MHRALKKKGRKSVEKQSMIYSYCREKKEQNPPNISKAVSLEKKLVKQQNGKP